MRKFNVCLVWTLMFKLQFVEILSDCDHDPYEYDYYEDYDYILSNIKCKFEDIYLPSQYPIHPILHKTHSSRAHFQLKISKSFIPHLHVDTFNVTSTYNMPMHLLEITESQMTKIDLEALTGFPHLLVLKLDYNNLTEIQQIFQAQTNLTQISLSHNNISWIDFDAFKPQKNKLIVLDLSFNSLDSTSILSNLDTFNRTTSLFRFSEYLTHLDLSNNQLEVLDRGTFSNNSNLLYLNLARNSLTEIKLRVLDKLSKLIYLNLSGNSISKLDLGFSIGLKSLKTLNLSFNRMNSIVSNLDSFNGTSLFGFSEHLEHLDLSNNQLEVLERATFSNYTNLLYLNLSKNSLTEIKLRVFDKLSELIYLNLSGNSISKLDIGFSIGLKSLKTLDLSFNRLSVLDPNVFHNTPVLENLQLHNNFLKNMSMVDLQYSTRLKSISIHDNNIDCSPLLGMLQILKALNISVDEGSATESYSFHGISCNVSSTTKKSLEPTSNSQNSYTGPPENVFQNSTFYELFSDFIKNQKKQMHMLTDIQDKLDARKSAANEKNEDMLVEKLKEIALKDKSQNETLILEIMRNLSASISEGNQRMEKQQLENFNNLQNILIPFMKDNEAKPSDAKNKPSNIFYIFINIFLFIIISLLALGIYLSYKFLTNRKFLKDLNEMQPIL